MHLDAILDYVCEVLVVTEWYSKILIGHST